MIRTIHHLSATGGTVICKLVAALDKVSLLSEVHPFAVGRVVFNPTGVLQQLHAQYGLLSATEHEQHFVYQLRLAQYAASRDGRSLVLRDHSHTDYLAATLRPFGPTPTLTLARRVDQVRSLVTVRHPIESFLSSLAQRWLEPIDNSFAEYCRRYVAFLEDYAGVPLIRYEDICARPKRTLALACRYLELHYDSGVLERFSKIRLTGDSGRKDVEIKVHPSKPVPEEYKSRLSAEMMVSAEWQRLAKQFGYSADLYGL